MASTTFRFLKFWTARQIFFQILCSKKIFENFFWSDQKTGLTARRVHYGPFRSPRSISGPYQKMTIPLLNSPKPHPLLINRAIFLFFRVDFSDFGGNFRHEISILRPKIACTCYCMVLESN